MEDRKRALLAEEHDLEAQLEVAKRNFELRSNTIQAFMATGNIADSDMVYLRMQLDLLTKEEIAEVKRIRARITQIEYEASIIDLESKKASTADAQLDDQMQKRRESAHHSQVKDDMECVMAELDAAESHVLLCNFEIKVPNLLGREVDRAKVQDFINDYTETYIKPRRDHLTVLRNEYEALNAEYQKNNPGALPSIIM